jgi:hypothetical protein
MMAELKRTTQTGTGAQTGTPPPGTEGEHNRGTEFGAAERATRGTDRDLDRSGESKNQGHGHPREERGASHD